MVVASMIEDGEPIPEEPHILDEAEAGWDERFPRSPDKLARLTQEARDEVARGDCWTTIRLLRTSMR